MVDGEGLGAALGERRVAVVNEIRGVPEEKRSGKRRRLWRVSSDEANRSLLNFLEYLHERGDVECVAQNVAISLEDHRERTEARCDLQQIVGALSLLPQRRAPLRPHARQQKCTRG